MAKAVDGKKTMTIAMRLLRSHRTVQDALREDHELEEVDSKNGTLYVGQSDAEPPGWVGFIDQFARLDPLLGHQFGQPKPVIFRDVRKCHFQPQCCFAATLAIT